MQPPSKRLRIAVETEAQIQPRGLLDTCTTPGGADYACNVAVGGTETTRRIKSVERVLCSQSLNTPHASGQEGTGWREAVSAVEDDFKISYSQSYKRTDTQSQQQHHSVSRDEGCDLFLREESRLRESEAGPRLQHTAPARNSLTPELVSEDHLMDCNTDSRQMQATRKLFPIFRPKCQWKVLHIIRHAESEFNAATNTGHDFKDPQIFNPKLTAKGRRQAAELRGKVAMLAKLEGALWVSSPLTRAIETMLLSCPKADLIGKQHDDAERDAVKVVIRHELTEHLVTTGDIGLPVTSLLHNFPQLREAMSGIPERWWFAPDSNDSLAQCFKKFEPKRNLQERVGSFRRWVQEQQEQVIVAYGHSSMLRELSGGRRLRNCEIMTLHL